MQIDMSELRKAERLAYKLLERVPGSRMVTDDDGLTIGVQSGAVTVWTCRELKGERDGAHGWVRTDDSRIEELMMGFQIKTGDKDADERGSTSGKGSVGLVGESPGHP